MSDSQITSSDPFDLAYEAFVADCMAEGIDPNSAEGFDRAASPEWEPSESDDLAHLQYAPTIEW